MGVVQGFIRQRLAGQVNELQAVDTEGGQRVLQVRRQRMQRQTGCIQMKRR